MPPTQDPAVQALTGQLAFDLILAALLAFPISLILLHFYHRAVLRGMYVSANRPKIAFDLPGASPGFDLPVQRALELVFLNESSARTATPEAENLYSYLLQRPWRTAAVYVAGGVCFALAMAFLSLLASKIGFLPVRFLTWFWMFAWPVVLMLNMTAATTWRTRWTILGVYFFVYGVFCLIGLLRSPDLTLWQLVLAWTITNLPPTLLMLTFLSHRIRAVGPLVLTFLFVSIAGTMVATTFIGGDPERIRAASDIGDRFGLGGVAVFIAILVLGFCLFGILGFLAVQGIRHQYERKELSDQSLAMDTLWLFFGVVYSIDLVFEGPAWILAGLGAFVLYKIVTWLGFMFLRGRSGRLERPRFLFLRVFSLGKRSERLYNMLATHWRHVGSIQFISGPDLAVTTVQPHHFLDFLVRRVARQFIDGYQALHHHVSIMDLEPDHDGRCRINDFFCHDDTWKMVLSHLVDTSEVVLMDIRGFSPQNAGCVFELNALINEMPLERVIFVIDGTTDARFLSETVQKAWREMKLTSPNRRSPSIQMRIFQYTGKGQCGLTPLLRALCIAANNAIVAERRTALSTVWDI